MGQLLEPAVSKKARLSYRLPRSLPMVEGDASQLRQVVMNLIMNASDALGGLPGHISVETSEEFLEVDRLRRFYLGESARPGRYAVLTVTDDGCGMDAATVQQIFDPFFTTKFTGRGLGLAAALGIVRTHRGLMSVESEPGRGTRFQILLPSRGDSPDTSDEEPTPCARPWLDGGSILVVDDESAVRHLAEAALRRSGFDVVLAEDGAVGLAQLERSPDTALVLLDLTMPELDGLQVLAKIRAMHPELPVLLSSGYTDESIPDDAFHGPTDFLRKPYMPSDLVASVTGMLESGDARRDGAKTIS